MVQFSKSSNSLDLRPFRTRGAYSDLRAVYVVTFGDEAMCKIGIAGTPSARLVSLQISHPEKLRFASLLWSPTSVVARKIEKHVHKLFGALRLSGEWFRVSPKQATETILTEARSLYPAIDFADHDKMAALFDSGGFGSAPATNYSHKDRVFLARAFLADPTSPVLPKLAVHEWTEVLRPMTQDRMLR